MDFVTPRWLETTYKSIERAQRVEKIAMIPKFVMDMLAKDAEMERIRVRRHDLLMAWVYVVNTPPTTLKTDADQK